MRESVVVSGVYAVLPEGVLNRNDQNHHFGQHDLIENQILVYFGPFWPKAGKKKVYTTTVEILLFSFFQVRGIVV